MENNVSQSGRFTPVMQFSVYSENKVGRLNELASILVANQVHIVAISSVDTTDSSIVRIVVDYPDQAEALLEENNFAFTKVDLVAVEFSLESELKKITYALLQAEINIHYLYPFLVRPHGKAALALKVEDNELAVEVLKKNNVRVLTQDDIAR